MDLYKKLIKDEMWREYAMLEYILRVHRMNGSQKFSIGRAKFTEDWGIRYQEILEIISNMRPYVKTFTTSIDADCVKVTIKLGGMTGNEDWYKECRKKYLECFPKSKVAPGERRRFNSHIKCRGDVDDLLKAIDNYHSYMSDKTFSYKTSLTTFLGPGKEDVWKQWLEEEKDEYWDKFMGE